MAASNPLKAPVAPITSDATPYPSVRFSEENRSLVKSLRQPEAVLKFLANKDMDPQPACAIPRELSEDPYYRDAALPRLATTRHGAVTTRPSTTFGRANQVAAYRALPREAPFGTQDTVGRMIRNRMQMSAGSEGALGRVRKAYPDKGASVRRPPTVAEVGKAIKNCGLNIPARENYKLFPLLSDEGEAVKVNVNSDNGFPVGGKMSDEPAMRMVLRLAHDMRSELDSLAHGAKDYSEVEERVRRWKRDGETQKPYLWLFKGKVKEDYYAAEKGEGLMLRFYNVAPRPISLLLQQATQPLEAMSRHMLQEDGLRTAQGISFAHSGAEEFVEVLEEQFDRDEYAYAHVGDDTFVVVKVDGSIVMFALDASNFDLTQHADTTEPVHDAIAGQLSLIAPARAALWYWVMRERLTLVSGTCVYRWKHAGPSGMPLQSKVNDVLMDVVVQRVIEEWKRNERSFLKAAEVDRILMNIGDDLGLKIRVEQHAVLNDCYTLRSALERQPFLFIGYYLYVEGGRVYCYADVDRTLAQRSTPLAKWTKLDGDLLIKEAARLGSIVISMGVPPSYHRESYEAMRLDALKTLKMASALTSGLEEELVQKLQWAMAHSPIGPEVTPSLNGMISLLENQEALRGIWVSPRLVTISTLLPADLPLAWFEEVEAEEEKEMGYSIPTPSRLNPRALVFVPKVVPMAPPTPQNFGRRPQTYEGLLKEMRPEKPKMSLKSDGGGKVAKKHARDRRAQTLLDYEQ